MSLPPKTAMKEASPKAMFWLEDSEPEDDLLIDGHFTFKKVAAIFVIKLKCFYHLIEYTVEYGCSPII